VTDPVRSLLEPLRHDVDGLPATPAAVVRARGDRRRRRQLTAAAALTVLVAVGIPAIGVLDLGGRGGTRPRPVPPASSPPTPSSAASPTSTLPIGTLPKIFPAGVPARLFLTGEDWTSDLLGTVTGDDPGQPEGSVAVHSCDRDSDPAGNVGVARYKAAGRFVATEKVRRLGSVSAMDAAITQARSDLTTSGCTAFLAGTAPNVEVSVRPLGEGTVTGGGRFMVRIDSRTKDGASKLTEWVLVGWDARSRTVWTVVLHAPLDLAAGQQETIRVENAAGERVTGTAP
jgi:hypothetical protein